MGHPSSEDAVTTVPFETGDAFELSQLETLRNFLPPDFWEYRERFFYEGMRLEIGPCFHDYSAPGFFHEATRKNEGQARLTEDGGLEDYAAGLPFPPGRIAVDDPQAGLKFAWNYGNRYQAAGWRGKFRRVDLLGRIGRAEAFKGEIFKLNLAHRADRAQDDYVAPGQRNKVWVSGGLFFEPFPAREFAWRQYRDLEHETKPARTDDLHAYLPDMRRVRRISSKDLEGVYMPAPSVGVVQSQQIAIAGSAGGIAGGVGGSVGGGPSSSITPKNTGFEVLEIRPLLNDWDVLGVQDVLTPINIGKPLYPEEPDREFGPWGLSFASDRWDLRRALILEGKRKGEVGGDQAARFVQYVDLQTLHPLYYMSFDSRDERIDVGYFVGRWSEEVEDYPRWPDDPERPIRVIDSVGAAFANLSERGSWRRECWDVVATPPDDRAVKRLLSVGNLTRRR